MEPDMKPLWSLGAVASSFVMLNQSTEDTLYNMAQVANVTQLVRVRRHSRVNALTDSTRRQTDFRITCRKVTS